jgi:hypothetical protein
MTPFWWMVCVTLFAAWTMGAVGYGVWMGRRDRATRERGNADG